jgi:hypothetical protein
MKCLKYNGTHRPYSSNKGAFEIANGTTRLYAHLRAAEDLFLYNKLTSFR